MPRAFPSTVALLALSCTPSPDKPRTLSAPPVHMPHPSAFAAPTATASATNPEPSYCDPDSFRRYELPVGTQAVQRLHAFKLGTVTLAGLAVGNSSVSGVEALARQFSTAGGDVGYCTWYYNVRNPEAARVFNHHPVVPSPADLTTLTGPELFLKIVGPNFDQSSVNYVTCAERFEYIALGCDAQKHRGPTVFAMLLAFSGCTPEHSVEIANGLWGLNGVPPEVRLAIARGAYDLGVERPESRKRLQSKFGQERPTETAQQFDAGPR